jgi:hypothetical protein
VLTAFETFFWCYLCVVCGLYHQPRWFHTRSRSQRLVT